MIDFTAGVPADLRARVPLCARPRACRAVLLGAPLWLAAVSACGKPALSWTDDASVATTVPLLLTRSLQAPLDSAMRDGTVAAELLLTRDLLREATAQTLLAPPLLAMPESRTGAERGTAMDMTMAMSLPASAQSLGDGDAPTDSVRCARSLRVALAPGRGRVAVWWSRRERGRVLLLAAWRDTLMAETRLGVWRGPIIVDSLDQGPRDAQAATRGAAGCARAAPSVMVDDRYGYVHVAYAMTGPEGPGVFYAHQMDPRAGFEVPQAIVYGDRLGAARVAAAGDLVAVAYDDPNGGERPRVGLAVSRTSGHVFEDRVIASSAIANASDPYVALKGRAMVMGWSEVPSGGGNPVFILRRATVRASAP